MKKLYVLSAALLLAPAAFAQSANDAGRSQNSSFTGQAAPAPNVVAGNVPRHESLDAPALLPGGHTRRCVR